MIASSIDEVCDAIILQLNSHVFGKAFEAVFYEGDEPFWQLAEIKDLWVGVMPGDVHRMISARGDDEVLFDVSVGLLQESPLRPATGANPRLSMARANRSVMQEVMEWISIEDDRVHRTLPTITSVRIDDEREKFPAAIKTAPLYDNMKLKSRERFVGVIELRYCQEIGSAT